MAGLKSIWILVASLALVSACCCTSSDELEAISNEQGEELNLYGPQSDEEVLELIGLDELDSMAITPVGSGHDTAAAPEEEAPKAAVEWKEPVNEMTLVRFFHGRYYQTQYSRMNEVLVKQVESVDLDSNMQVLSNWYENERQRGVSLLNQATVEALEQMLSLTKITDTNKCNRDTYTILVKNDRATGGRTHKPPSQLKLMTRVDYLVNQVAMKHAIECFHVYPAEYARIRDTVMNQESRQVVEAFMNALIGDPFTTTSRISSVTGKKAAELAWSTINSRAYDDPDRRFLHPVVDELKARMVVNGAKINALLHKYLTEPCREFNEALGPDVFIPIRYDLEMLEKEDRYDAAGDKRVAEFMHGWIHYKLCKLLVDRDELKLAKHIVEYVNQREKELLKAAKSKSG